MAFNFWQQAALNAVGPLLTVCLGSLLVAGVASWVSRRSQDRRLQHELRESLVAEMALVAYDLYFRCSHLERGQRHGDLAGEELKKARARLDDVYVACPAAPAWSATRPERP